MASTDALPIPRKNVAYRVTFPILDADGDLVTGAGSLDSEISKDGGTFTDCTNEATEIATSSGMYYLDLTSTEMNADCVAIIVKSASGKTTPIVLYPEELGDMRANVGQWNGTAIPSEHTAGYPIVTVKDGTGTGEINTNAGAIAVVDLVTLVTTATTLTNLPAITAGWLTAAGIDADAITAAKLAADVTTELQAGLATAANLATVAGYIDTEVASILAAVDTEIATIVTHLTDIKGAGWTTTDTLEAIRDRGDAAWVTATGFSTHSAADVWAVATRSLTVLDEDSTTLDLDATIRAAVGLASANIDTQIADLPTNAELATAIDAIPTAAENATALLDLAAGVETGLTLRQALRLVAAAAAGKLSGAATTTIVIRNAVADSKDRITATVDADGNRSAITVDLT